MSLLHLKRKKHDATEAESICEGAQRPSMRFVAVKSEEQQANAMVFHGRDLLVGQRTQIINALRGHMAEHGWVAPKGPSHIAKLAELLENEAAVPTAARPVLAAMLEMLAGLDRRIALLDREIASRAREDETARRLMTTPGIGRILAQMLARRACWSRSHSPARRRGSSK